MSAENAGTSVMKLVVFNKKPGKANVSKTQPPAHARDNSERATIYAATSPIAEEKATATPATQA
jgi:hypothetical protein